MALDDATWTEIARIYRAGDVAVSVIVERYGLTRGKLYRGLLARGVPRRTDTRKPATRRSRADRSSLAGGMHETSRAKAAGRAPGDGAGDGKSAARATTASPAKSGAATAPSGARKKTASRRALVARLYRAIDLKLQRLERRMSSGEEPTIADSERETRELGQMIRSFEKVTEVAADIAQAAAKPASAGGKAKSGAAAAARSDAGEPVYISADAERMRHEIAERLERLHRGRATGK